MRRRCDCRALRRISAIPLGEGAIERRAHSADADRGTAHRPLSGTAGLAYAGCGRLHGKDCSYNPFAFPPSLEVRCRRYDPRASIVPTMLLHFLRPWRSDGGGRAKQEPEPRATQGAVAERRRRPNGRNTRKIALKCGLSPGSGGAIKTDTAEPRSLTAVPWPRHSMDLRQGAFIRLMLRTPYSLTQFVTFG